MTPLGDLHPRKLVRRSVTLTCGAYLVDDWLKGRRLARGRLGTRSGATHAGRPVEWSLDYVETVYRDYCRYAGVESFHGTVAEVGPGDNFGVALLLLANGAKEVHAIDRYAVERDPEAQRRIYRALRERNGLAELFDGEPGEDTIRGLERHAGRPAEAFFRESGLAFDAILSRAVMEHLYDPIAALDAMLESLRPGGVLVHRIDLRDHGMFAGKHPLTFLTVPDPLYRRMTRNAGRPNRVLFSDYREWAGRSGAAAELLVSRLVGIERDLDPAPWGAIEPAPRETAEAAVREARPRLADRFRAMSDAEVAVAGCVLVARKAGTGSP